MIRRATPDDAPVLSALARECFTQTFGHLYTAEDLTAFLDQAYSPAVLRAELEDPEYATGSSELSVGDRVLVGGCG